MELIQQAKEYLLKTLKVKNTKFKYLPEWILFLSKQFYKEAISKNKPVYRTYRRGTLIYVKFGVNIGSKLSGNHFAVVLDKTDKTSKGTLTVVPLSSKPKKQYQQLHDRDDIFKLSCKYHVTNLSKYTQQEATKLKELSKDLGQMKKDIEEFKNKIKNNENFNFKTTIKNNEIETEEEFRSKINNHVKWFKKYNKYRNKKSYACTNMIQTISKEKILSTTPYETAGNIQISEESLNLIEEKIKNMYFNN